MNLTKLVMAILLCGAPALEAQNLQLEKMQGKTILVFTPHPDDDTFCCAGTLALLTRAATRSTS